MTGSPSMPGLTPKAIDELFRLIAEKPQLSCKVRSTPSSPSIYNCVFYYQLFYIAFKSKNKK